MNRVKEVERINAKDLQLQLASDTVGNAGRWDVNKSWHAQYKDSAYVYVGGLSDGLSEGDVIVICSQFGEVVDINMPRDRKTGKTKGFAFICYEDQRSTVLAVDNFNGAKVLGRTIRCDHCQDYHEEQAKDPANLPDHVTRKLSEKELDKKRQEVEARNAELEEAARSKASLFAIGRGTHEGESQRDERQIRQSIMASKEADANRQRLRHIEEVLARKKEEANKAASEEARKQAAWEERKRLREEEEKAAASGVKLKTSQEKLQDPVTVAVSESRWDRLMNGGGKKKKAKRAPAASEAASRQATSGDSERKKPGEDGLSVDETNRMRAALGMAPLR
mmetsp:Transcript_11505/g.23410  ORF Transcript_11505/g.23410 Transcript_11505/m.23410 type:complete len:336 (-) Transcript_11505:117-1124(-)